VGRCIEDQELQVSKNPITLADAYLDSASSRIFCAEAVSVERLSRAIKVQMPSAHVFIIDGKTIRDFKSMSLSFSSAFSFPGYYGDNWDAMHDCMRDLEWLNPRFGWKKLRDIALIISDAESMFPVHEDLFQKLVGALKFTPIFGVPCRSR
jgi:RNAse (barnase) inhibitor barstar